MFPVKVCKISPKQPQSISEGGRIWQVWSQNCEKVVVSAAQLLSLASLCWSRKKIVKGYRFGLFWFPPLLGNQKSPNPYPFTIFSVRLPACLPVCLPLSASLPLCLPLSACHRPEDDAVRPRKFWQGHRL